MCAPEAAPPPGLNAGPLLRRPAGRPARWVLAPESRTASAGAVVQRRRPSLRKSASPWRQGREARRPPFLGDDDNDDPAGTLSPPQAQASCRTHSLTHSLGGNLPSNERTVAFVSRARAGPSPQGSFLPFVLRREASSSLDLTHCCLPGPKWCHWGPRNSKTKKTLHPELATPQEESEYPTDSSPDEPRPGRTPEST